MHSPDRPFDDDHIITAYGDISQSEIYFVPSAPSETCPTPTRQKKTYRRNAKKPLPPLIKKNIQLRTQDDVSNGDSITEQAQKAAMSQPELDFETLVANLREMCDKLRKDSPDVPYLKSIEDGACAPTRQSVGEKGVPFPKTPASSKPWRRGPRSNFKRPPLPRWDLMDPDVILEGGNYRLKST